MGLSFKKVIKGIADFEGKAARNTANFVAKATLIDEIARGTGRVMQTVGRNIPEFSASNPARFLNNAVIRPVKTAESNIGTIATGKNPYTGNLRQQSGQALEDVLTVGSFIPAGKTVELASKGLPAIKAGAKTGLKVGTGFGAGQGIATANKENMNLEDSLKTIAANTIGGGTIGVATGVAAPAIVPTAKLAGKGVVKGVQAIDNQAQRATERNPAGEIGSVGRNVNKPKVTEKTVAQAGKAERERAEKFVQSEISGKDKVKDFISGNFTDDTKPFQELDTQIAKKKGVKVRDLPATDRLDPNIQAFRNTKAMQKQYQQDVGIEDFAKKLSNQKEYDAYRIYRTYQTNSERAAVNKRRNESLEDAYKRFSGGRILAQDEAMAKSLDANPKYGQLFTEENAITQKILRDRGNNPNLTLSPQEAEAIIAKYPRYTPQYRSIEDDLISFRNQGNVGSQQGKNVKTLDKGSTTRPIQDPLTALRGYSEELVSKSQGNKVMDLLVENFPEKFRPLRTEAQMRAKEDAVVTMGELGVAGKAVQKELRKNSKTARSLETELNNLNKKGVKVSVRQKEKPKATLAQKTVTVKTVRGYMKPTAPKTLDELSQSYNVKATLQKEYGNGANAINQMAADVENGGWTQLMDLNPNITRATAESIAGQLLKKPKEFATKIDVKEGKIGRDASTQKLIENLIKLPNKELRPILDKIARRDAKLAPLMDEIGRLRNQSDDIRAAKAGVMSSGDLAAFEKAANKNTKRRVTTSGYEEIYEVVDARLAKNLDNLKGHQLSDAAQVLGIPTRFFKFFTTGPGNTVAFVPIALTRDVFASVLFAKAPVRALIDPRSYVDAFAIAAKQGDLYKQLQRRGASGTMVEGDRLAKEASSNAMRNTGLKRAKVYAQKPSQIFRDLEDVDMAAERFTRGRLASARYRQQLSKYSKDPNLTIDQAKDKALWDATEEFREGLLNFGRSGRVTRELNSVAAYLNPAVQAGNKVRRSITENPADFAVRASVATGLLYGGYAYSHIDQNRTDIYNKISEEEKRGNIILVGPNSKWDDEKGTATGIIKIPLAYELRPAAVAVQETFKQAAPKEYGDLALAGISTLTGLDTKNMSSFIGQFVPSQGKPVIENVANFSFFTGKQLTPDYIKEKTNGDKTQQANNSSSGTSKFISRASGGKVSPIEADNLLRGAFGGASKDILSYSDKALNKAGKITDEETTDSGPLTRLKKRYTESYGESAAIRFFNRLDSNIATLPDQSDREAMKLLHTKNSEPGILNSAEKAGIYLNRPNVLAAERKLDAENRKEGKPGNPLFDLSDTDLKKVMTYRQAKMLNAGKQTYSKDGEPLFVSLGLDEPWYQNFRDQETVFYDNIKKAAGTTDLNDNEGKTFSGAAKPKLSDEQQKIQDYYNTLPKGTGQRSAFLKANPWLLSYWEESDGFTNKERASIGLKPLDDASAGGGGYGGYGGGGNKRTAGLNKNGEVTLDPFKYAISAKTGTKKVKPKVTVKQTSLAGKQKGVDKSKFKVTIKKAKNNQKGKQT